jgi:GT2 family glycosyltransferase
MKLPNLKTLLDIPNAKKISYVFFMPCEALSSADHRRQTTRAIVSILNQSVPLCDLLVIAHQNIVAQTKKLIDQCLKKYQPKDIKKTTDDLPLKKSKVATTHINSNSKADPCIRLYESPLDDLVSAMSLVSTQIQTEWVVFLDSGTQVAPSATYQLTQAIIQQPDSELIYADHDVVDGDGARSCPSFKPIFSLDLLYSQNYIGSFFAIKTQNLINSNLSNTRYHFSYYTFDLILSLIEKLIKLSQTNLRQLTKKIIHLPYMLHSENKQDLTLVKKMEINSRQLERLKKHFSNCYKNVSCSQIKPFLFRHRWPLEPTEALVSLIIPTKNGYDILKACVSSIIEKTTYKNYEIIIIDNQTTDVKALKYLNKIASRYSFIKIIKYDKPFNYSDINNIAVKQAKGHILGFLNNDVEVITPDWLTEMVSHAVRPDIGCVGAMHYYPDMHIQHAGVIVGMNGVADHAFKDQKKSSRSDISGYLYSIRNPDAVTAATLVVKRELFDLVGGFDSEHLKIAFNDVDLCLKIAAKGYRCLWTPYAELFHYESKTRNLEGPDNDSQQIELYEHRIMKERWMTGLYPQRDLLRSINLLKTALHDYSGSTF